MKTDMQTIKISEDKLQSDCFQWFWNNYPQYRMLLWAVPNGGYRNKREAVKLKATGLVKGVHDLHFFFEQQFYTFELKIDDNNLSDEQMMFWSRITEHGGKCFEIRTFESFKVEMLKIIN